MGVSRNLGPVLGSLHEGSHDSGSRLGVLVFGTPIYNLKGPSDQTLNPDPTKKPETVGVQSFALK